MNEIEWNEFWHKLFGYADKKYVGVDLSPVNWQNKFYKGNFQRLPTYTGLPVDFAYLIRGDYISIALRIHNESFQVYKRLKQKKDEINNIFGAELTWDPHKRKINPNIKMMKIQYQIYLGGFRNPKRFWPYFHIEMVEVMVKLRYAIDPFLNKFSL